jgi:3-polyprenyl-4-hydroxybenzoate decarboxylase
MSYSDLHAFLADLGSDLLQVKQAFDPKHKMAALLRAGHR